MVGGSVRWREMVDPRVVEEVESMDLQGYLDGKVFKNIFQILGFITWVNFQTNFNSSPWNWLWGGGSLQNSQNKWMLCW